METSPENLNEQMIQIIFASMQEKPDAELIAIFSAYDDIEYSPEAFEAMRRILQARGIPTNDLPRSRPRSVRQSAIHRAAPPTYITPRLRRLLIIFTCLPALIFVTLLIVARLQPAGSDIAALIFALIFFLLTCAMAYAWYVKAHPDSFGSFSKRLSKTLFSLIAPLCILSAVTGVCVFLFSTVFQVSKDIYGSIVIISSGDSAALPSMTLTMLIVGSLLLLRWWLASVSPTINSDY